LSTSIASNKTKSTSSILETFIKKYSSDYAHPRNLVAGIVRDENENDSRIEDVDLVLLEAIEVDNSEITLLGFTQLFPEFPNKADFEIINDMYELREAYNKMYNSRSDYKYPTDGLVYASLEKTSFKHNGHHPEHAISIKFKPPRLISTIEKITWRLHRTGNWKPLLQFNKLIVDGRTIQRASGYYRHSWYGRAFR
jgi:NAD-dependent DNA ligase